MNLTRATATTKPSTTHTTGKNAAVKSVEYAVVDEIIVAAEGISNIQINNFVCKRPFADTGAFPGKDRTNRTGDSPLNLSNYLVTILGVFLYRFL